MELMAEEKSREDHSTSTQHRSTKKGAEYENMPKSAPPYMYSIYKQPLPHDIGPISKADTEQTPLDGAGNLPFDNAKKPGPFCGRCPLKDQPYVGGRGGAA